MVEYQPYIVAPNDALLVNCRVSAPPDRNLYLSVSQTERERMLAEAWMEQTTNLVNCNMRLEDLRQWKINIEKN